MCDVPARIWRSMSETDPDAEKGFLLANKAGGCWWWSPMIMTRRSCPMEWACKIR